MEKKRTVYICPSLADHSVSWGPLTDWEEHCTWSLGQPLPQRQPARSLMSLDLWVSTGKEALCAPLACPGSHVRRDYAKAL